jgi:glycosyltransferase involved in cell wall biosynthesis
MITIITPTGGRAEAFELCEKYMFKQTLKYDEWLVVDDCLPRTKLNLGQTAIYPEKIWQQGDMTLTTNLITALKQAKGDYVLIIEDDDYYKQNYIETMLKYLQQYDLVGEGRAKYYNIANHRCMIHNNMKHASLCQTGFAKKLIPDIIKCIEANIGQKFIDLEIWKLDCNKHIFEGENISVGIKGMPGRNGLGYGHKDNMGKPDKKRWHTLRNWIGNDFKIYENLKCTQAN